MVKAADAAAVEVTEADEVQDENDATRVSGSAHGEAAKRIRAIAKELKCSSRTLVEFILEYADPTPAVHAVLEARKKRELEAIESLKNRFGK